MEINQLKAMCPICLCVKEFPFIWVVLLIISANLFHVKRITLLGIEKHNFEVCSYLLGQPEDEIKGVVGLDFFEDKKICIDFKKSVITIT